MGPVVTEGARSWIFSIRKVGVSDVISPNERRAGGISLILRPYRVLRDLGWHYLANSSDGIDRIILIVL